MSSSDVDTESQSDSDFDSNTVDKSIKRRLNMSKQYLNEETADVFFTCGDDENKERIPAHKFVLFTQSDVFDRMFHGSLPEGNEIRIADASPNGFRTFLRYFYFNNYKLNIDVVGEMMYLAKKYNVDECFEVCYDFLQNIVFDTDELNDMVSKDKHIIIGYELSIAYELTDLIEIFESAICFDYSNEVFGSEYIRSISVDLLKTILQIDDIYLCAKLAFDACMRWAEDACNNANIDPSVMQNRRKQLGDCLNYIEFGAMKRNEVVQCVKTFGDLFTPREIQRFISMIASKCPMPFNKDKMIRYNIITSTETKIQIQANYTEKLNFSTQNNILLGGFKLALNNANDFWYFRAMLRILETSADKQTSENIVLAQEKVYVCERRSSDLILDQPIFLEPHSTYSVQLTIGWVCGDLWYYEHTISLPEDSPFRILPESNTNLITELLCNGLE